MRFKFLLLIFFSLFIYAAHAADTIIVHKDARLDILTERQIAINKLSAHMGSNGMFIGYRLQILNTRNRDEAFKTKTTILQNFPDEKVYVLYQSPYFKVRVGNFLKRSDAEDFGKEISSYITQPAYIVDDMIEYVPKPEDFQ